MPAQVIGEPPLFDVVFTAEAVRDYRGTLRADAAVQQHVNRHLRASGILKGDSKYYISLAHDDRDVAQTLDAFQGALASLPGGAEPGPPASWRPPVSFRELAVARPAASRGLRPEPP